MDDELIKIIADQVRLGRMYASSANDRAEDILAALRAHYLLVPKEGPGWGRSVRRALKTWANGPGGAEGMEAALRAAGGESE